MLKDKYIITGIPPTGSSGTGDFLLFLKKNMKIKIAWKPVSFVSAIKIFFKCTYKSNCDFHELFKSLILYWTEVYPIVKFKKKRIKSHPNLYLFHPQSVSYKFVNRMTNLRIIKGIYILDNSYFCFASYNWRKTEPHKACKKCIQNKNDFVYYGCKDIFRNNTNQYKLFRENLYKGFMGRVFVQNYSHKNLFSIVSKGREATMVGMLPESLFINKKDLSEDKEKYYSNIFNRLNNKYQFVVVCHINFSGAKGYFLIKEVSRYLQDISFIFPFKKPIEEKETQENLIFLPCSWETGLRYLCKESDMVFIPSIWTMQVEGALLKSCLIAKRLVSIAESIIDKRDYIEGVYYLSNSEEIELMAKKISNILNLPPNKDTLNSSINKYISKTKKTLEELFS